MMPLSPPAEFLVLHGRQSSLVIECPPGEAPLWRYWGPRLPEGSGPGTGLRDQRCLPSFNLDHDQPLSLVPGFGVGWFNQSALLAHRGGRDFAQAFTGCTVHVTEPGRALHFELSDVVAGLRVDLHLRLDPASDVLVAHSTLTNLGDAPLDVQWLAAATLPLPGRCDQVRGISRARSMPSKNRFWIGVPR